MEFDWPDNLAEEIWGDLPDNSVTQGDVETVLELLRPQVVGLFGELKRELAIEKRRVRMLRQNNRLVHDAVVDYLMKVQEALAEIAPDHELLHPLQMADVT